MKLVHHLTWQQVFDGWREREAADPGWIRCATTIKGWPDWESWRRFTADQLTLPTLQWELHACTDPMIEIPAMLIGPYSGWQSRVPETNTYSFLDLVAIPKEREEWKKTPKIISMTKHFPSPTTFIGLVSGDTKKIVCIEGHHRAVSVALAAAEREEIHFDTAPMIALATLPADRVFLLDETVKRGSTKAPR